MDSVRSLLASAVWCATLALSFGCGANSDLLLARAPRDLSCARDQLRTRTLVDALGHGKTVVVHGCGKQQTYVAVCNGDGLWQSCTWIRDGAMETVSPR